MPPLAGDSNAHYARRLHSNTGLTLAEISMLSGTDVPPQRHTGETNPAYARSLHLNTGLMRQEDPEFDEEAIRAQMRRFHAAPYNRPTPILDRRSPEEIARTRETHQSRRIWALSDLHELLDQVGSSGGPEDQQRQERARSYVPRLEAAMADILIFREQEGTPEGQAALDRFREAAWAIAEAAEDEHRLDSPDSQLLTRDYNNIFEALRTMFARFLLTRRGFTRRPGRGHPSRLLSAWHRRLRQVVRQCVERCARILLAGDRFFRRIQRGLRWSLLRRCRTGTWLARLVR